MNKSRNGWALGVAALAGCGSGLSLKDAAPTTVAVTWSHSTGGPQPFIVELMYEPSSGCPHLDKVTARLNGTPFPDGLLGGPVTDDHGNSCLKEAIWNSFVDIPFAPDAEITFTDDSTSLTFDAPTLLVDHTPTLDMASSDLHPKGKLVVNWPIPSDPTTVFVDLFQGSVPPTNSTPPFKTIGGDVVDGKFTVDIPTDFSATSGFLLVSSTSTVIVATCPVSTCTAKLNGNSVTFPFTLTP